MALDFCLLCSLYYHNVYIFIVINFFLVEYVPNCNKPSNLGFLFQNVTICQRKRFINKSNKCSEVVRNCPILRRLAAIFEIIGAIGL